MTDIRDRLKPKVRATCWVSAILVALLAADPSRATAQSVDTTSAARWRPLVTVGSAADDSARLGALLGETWGNRSLIRSSLSLNGTPPDRRELEWSLFVPVVTIVRNSALALSMNDGAMWAGRGLNTSVTIGFAASLRNVRLVVAPELLSSANDPLVILPSGSPARSGFASPFHSGRYGADIPSRFGNSRYTHVVAGETSLQMLVGRASVGVTSSSMWWGPGQQNALLMSNNAAGIPHLFVRTARPLRTPAGEIEAHWLLGGLTESPFFDTDPRNDLRALSAAVITLRTAADSGLTVGAGRSVFSNARNFGGLFGHFADVLASWRRPDVANASHGDQIFSLFADWIVPASRLEAYVEWARIRLPASVREVLVEPQHTQGYTVGLQWASPRGEGRTFRLRGEATMLEQTPLTAGAEMPEFYTSSVVPQGYTQRGQVIGAAIGPGSSSQWLSGHYYARRWQLGAEIGRIRWEDGAFYRSPAALSHYAHDVSLFAGLSGRYDTRWLAAEASVVGTRRMNYLFQTTNPYDPGITAFDFDNSTLRLRLTPHW